MCVESHLRPAHNKREYLSHATNTEVHALYKSVDERMRRHLKECVVDCFRSAVAPLSNLPRDNPPLPPSAPSALAPAVRLHSRATADPYPYNGPLSLRGGSYEFPGGAEGGYPGVAPPPKPGPAARFMAGQRL